MCYEQYDLRLINNNCVNAYDFLIKILQVIWMIELHL